MDTLARFLLLLVLVLIQVTIFPINFGFTLLVAALLFVKNFQIYGWLVTLSLLVALFSNLNPGLVLLAFGAVILLILVIKSLVPDNRLTRIFLVIAAIPLANVGLIFFGNILR